MSRIWRLLFILPILLLPAACDTGEAMDLRLFCQRYSRTAEAQARLRPEQFLARRREDGCQYEAYIAEHMLLALDTQPDGRVHTISLTALPEGSASAFRRAGAAILETYCGVAGDAAERWLNGVHAGEAEILGYQTREEGGFRLTYAANEAGRYMRVSQLRYLPEEAPLPTLKNIIETAAEDPLPPLLEEWATTLSIDN